MEKPDELSRKNEILQKIGVDLREFNKPRSEPAHECDNLPNPFDNLTLDELYYLQDHNFFLDDYE